MLVKIIRETIKPNPRAGQTRTPAQGHWEATFTAKATGSILPFIDKLMFTDMVVITAYSDSYAEGLFYRPDEIEAVLKIGKEENLNVDVSVKNDIEYFEHHALPKYLYEYENPTLECDNCKAQVLLSDIEREYGDNGYKYDICPKCTYNFTFEERTYEKISDVIK